MTNNKIIIGIVGEMGAGKGSAAKYIQDKYGAESFRFSTMLRDILRRLHLPDIRENMQNLSTSLRQTFGDDLMTKVMAQDVAASSSLVIVTEGIRRPGDMTYLSEMPGFHLIAIVTDEKLRYERIHGRNENANDATITWDDFKKESSAEPEMRIRDIAAKAEFTVDNNGTLDDLHKNLDAIMDKIKNLPA